MTVKTFAGVFGGVLLALGIFGFIPGFLSPTMEHPGLLGGTGSGYLFSLFAVNSVHSLVHLAAGAWGLWAMRSITSARFYAIAMMWVFAILTIMGLIPRLDVGLGLVPLFGHDVWLHALLAAIAGWFAYFGYETDLHPRGI